MQIGQKCPRADLRQRVLRARVGGPDVVVSVLTERHFHPSVCAPGYVEECTQRYLIHWAYLNSFSITRSVVANPRER